MINTIVINYLFLHTLLYFILINLIIQYADMTLDKIIFFMTYTIMNFKRIFKKQFYP